MNHGQLERQLERKGPGRECNPRSCAHLPASKRKTRHALRTSAPRLETSTITGLNASTRPCGKSAAGLRGLLGYRSKSGLLLKALPPSGFPSRCAARLRKPAAKPKASLPPCSPSQRLPRRRRLRSRKERNTNAAERGRKVSEPVVSIEGQKEPEEPGPPFEQAGSTSCNGRLSLKASCGPGPGRDNYRARAAT